MKLYLVRHGDASAAASDALRPLSARGKEEIKKMAGFLQASGVEVNVIWHSGLLRAEQTAEIIAESLKSRVAPKKSLKPDDPVVPIAEEIEKCRDDLLIAGHMPHLSYLTSQLLLNAQKRDAVVFKKGAAVCLEKNDDGRWDIKWLVTPDTV